MKSALLLSALVLCQAQQFAEEVPEVHPKLAWKSCDRQGSCRSVKGEVTLDANWRWLHLVNSTINCMETNQNWKACHQSADECTERCALDGAAYWDTYGIKTKGDGVSMQYKTIQGFTYTKNSRIFLMESEHKYQMFTLLNNEIAVDVDVNTVECGLNAKLFFVAMEQDGGMARYPTNKAGAKYGTGYCDTFCSMKNKFNGGKANADYWVPDSYDPFGGEGYYGSCCPEFDVLNSNAYSYFMSAKPCRFAEYRVCDKSWCDKESDDTRVYYCDKLGCEYQPYKLGFTDFYGRGKTVDTTKNYTIVTRFEDDQITQFFIQDGKKIEVPYPTTDDLPNKSGISADYCKAKQVLFNEHNRFDPSGGWTMHQQAIRQPMVLTMAITDDYWAHNLYLDSLFPLENEGLPGSLHGPCAVDTSDPEYTSNNFGRATVKWSNIRFGPIGSTTEYS
jgi:cellulose 1,4-beta-cellobiosidase